MNTTFNLIILVFIIFCGLIGFKRGVIKELVVFGEILFAYIIAFILKNPISIILYRKLPFFSFDGIFKGVSVLNIIIYEIIAFLGILFLIIIIFKILKLISSLIEKIFKATIILAIPSKILGAVVGLLQGYLIVFIFLFIANLPIVTLSFVEETSFTNLIINKTPVISEINAPMRNAFDEIYSLKAKYKEIHDPNEFNKETLKILLKYKIVDIKSVDYLLESGKLSIDNIEEVLTPYREEEYDGI